MSVSRHSVRRSFLFGVAVLVALAVAAVVERGIWSVTPKTAHSLAEAPIDKVAGQLEMYRMDNGTYPSMEQGLEALVVAPTSHPQPRNWRRAVTRSAPT